MLIPMKMQQTFGLHKGHIHHFTSVGVNTEKRYIPVCIEKKRQSQAANDCYLAASSPQTQIQLSLWGKFSVP